MRLATSVIAALIAATAWTTPVSAGDVADVNVLGFSADGGVFAFEEYGVQDGSGFPYANRFYIDTTTDKFLPGTPIRVRLDDEARTVGEARAEAAKSGQKIIADAVLEQNRGHTAGFSPVTEFSSDPHRMVVNPRPVFSPVDPEFEVRLQEFPLNGDPLCESQGEVVGFRLVRIDPSPDGQTKLIHEDKTLPKSRNCPNGYRIGGIQTGDIQHTLTSYAVLIAVRSYGFEGPDFRWIAVTGRF